MKFSSLVLTSIFCCISIVSYGQNSKGKSINNGTKGSPVLMKRVNTNNPSTTKVEPKSSTYTKKASPPKKLDRSTSTVRKLSYSKSTPATRMSAVKTKTTINNQVDPTLSDIDNLFNLMEEKENVSKYGSESLRKSDSYSILNNNIIALKSKFKAYVENKGIQNCSSREQNFYLASLKEDGKEEEYKNNVELIKSSK